MAQGRAEVGHEGTQKSCPRGLNVSRKSWGGIGWSAASGRPVSDETRVQENVLVRLPAACEKDLVRRPYERPARVA